MKYITQCVCQISRLFQKSPRLAKLTTKGSYFVILMHISVWMQLREQCTKNE